ncbi:hypothetical protein POTOM_019553 [Populus tomentosa]|uniref:Uncharacterized protein n=1 Tax=Populus tomentosa TaxID=118781 RepID=A0A8X8A7N6_POPTO|nr:hypothetical protein POTOM_019553 [Populus tomentosa]
MDIPPSKTMSEKEAEKDQKDKIVKARANTNRVIISIYSESPRKRLQQKHNPATKKTTMRTRGYDRRAQLLSYASELRCAGSEPMEWSRRNSRPMSKKWKWSSGPARIRESFLRMFQQKERQCVYERIVTEENGEADRMSGSQRINSTNQTGVSDSRKPSFCVNLINHFKEIDVHAQGIKMWIAVQQGLKWYARVDEEEPDGSEGMTTPWIAIY